MLSPKAPRGAIIADASPRPAAFSPLWSRYPMHSSSFRVLVLFSYGGLRRANRLACFDLKGKCVTEPINDGRARLKEMTLPARSLGCLAIETSPLVASRHAA